MNTEKKISCVIYDMDGLLLDTEPFYTQATQKIVAPFGKTFDWKTKSKMIGQKQLDAAKILVEDLNLPITPQEYLIQREVILKEIFPNCKPLPGAVRLTQHLKKYNIPQAIATSSSNKFYLLKTKKHQEWFQIFEYIVTGDDPEVIKGKPAPDIYLVAARRLGIPSENCLIFEDAPSGVKAAVAAKMSVIAVPDPHLNKNIFENADLIINNLNEFKPDHWGLPAFDD